MIQLDKEVQRRLLEALRTDRINLIDFPELRQQANEPTSDLSRLTEEKTSRLNELCLKVKCKPIYVPLTKSLKIRLIESVRAGAFNPAKFPELITAYTHPEFELSTLSDEEIDFIAELAIKCTGP